MPTGRPRRVLVLDTILLGVAGALAARAFVFLLEVAQRFFLNWIAGYVPPSLPSEGSLAEKVGPHGLWLIPLATTIGGLLTGLLVYGLAPETEGHGTDTVVAAFHRTAGAIRARVPFVKLIASAVTIGSGGAAGREGPVALISAGIGSAYARRTGHTQEETRLLLLAGMAAGLSAVFRSPVGTAVFAAEVLYSEMEFEGGVLFYTMLASIVAYTVNGLFVGLRPLFQFPARFHAPEVASYGWYLLLGVASGAVARVVPLVLYTIRDGFHRLALPRMLKPAIGGLGVGLIGLVLPQVLAGGYGWVQQAIDGKLALPLLLGLAFAKLLAFALTIGSGGSGGVFAPSLYVGAMLGGFLAQVFHQPSAAFVVVGMAAVFAGAARVPIATLLMVTEMTADYAMFVPAALAVMASHFVQASLSRRPKYKSLYEAQVPTRADSPAHHVHQVQVALNLLSSKVPVSGIREISPLALTALLTSGLPVHLPDGRQVHLGVIKRESACIGKPLGSGCLGPPAEVRVMLALRGNDLLWPGGDGLLRAGDRLVLVATDQAWTRISERDVQPMPS